MRVIEEELAREVVAEDLFVADTTICIAVLLV